jgi:hypothetical protein
MKYYTRRHPYGHIASKERWAEKYVVWTVVIWTSDFIRTYLPLTENDAMCTFWAYAKWEYTNKVTVYHFGKKLFHTSKRKKYEQH